MPFGGALTIGGGALLGGIAGGMRDKTNVNSASWLDAGGPTASETTGQQGLMDAYKQLQGLVGAGPGQSDVESATGANRSLADMLKSFSQGGFLPGQQDINTSNDIASKLFQAQRTQLGQNFYDQQVNANRQAALMGRDPNDPILRNKLAQEQTRQQQMLDANQGSFAQQFALSMPTQRLGYMQDYAGVQSGLATQAMQNRQMLASMGEGIMNNERNFRLQTAKRYGDVSQESGGGLKGFLTGAMGGAGMGASLASGMGAFNSSPSQGTPGASGTGAITGWNYGQSPSSFFGLGAQPAQPPSVANGPFGGSYTGRSLFSNFGTMTPGQYQLPR